MSDVRKIEDQITEAGAVALDDSELEAVHGGAYEFYMKREDWSLAFKMDVLSPSL